MNKTVRASIFGIVVIALSMTGVACHKNKKPEVKPETIAPTVTEPPAPKVEARIEQPTDFVPKTDTTPVVTQEVLPRDLESLNRVAQEKGYIQDAFYNYDEAALSSDAQAALTASATWLKQHGDLNLLVEGHCDERGTEQYNLALGDRRANSAKDYLVTLGVDSSRIRTVSYGEERPFDAGHDEAAWGKNRRAHLVLVK
jgi:peptidoglycan-associated lipoprotein